LKIATHALVLSTTVGEVVAAPEHSGRRDGDLFDAEVNAEDYTVLGVAFIRYL
jgi:hypothetical protein